MEDPRTGEVVEEVRVKGEGAMEKDKTDVAEVEDDLTHSNAILLLVFRTPTTSPMSAYRTSISQPTTNHFQTLY